MPLTYLVPGAGIEPDHCHAVGLRRGVLHSSSVGGSDRRSRGVGAQRLNSLITLLPYPWRLKCVAANTRALLFYERQGWTKEGEGDRAGRTVCSAHQATTGLTQGGEF